MNRKTTVELEHILRHKKYFPVETVNSAHREHSKRLRKRRLKKELKETFEKFGSIKK